MRRIFIVQEPHIFMDVGIPTTSTAHAISPFFGRQSLLSSDRSSNSSAHLFSSVCLGIQVPGRRFSTDAAAS